MKSERIPVRIFEDDKHACRAVAAEIAALVDGGYQKFWRAGNRRVPALAQQLKALHDFEEDLREALGLESLYNTSLGTTNDLHVYDRLAGRENPPEVTEPQPSGSGHRSPDNR